MQKQQTQAIQVEVVSRAEDGRITQVRILNRTVEMADLISHAKKNCPDCGRYHGTPLQGTYQQVGKDGQPFLNLCGCTVRRYVRQNAEAMAREMKPEPTDHEAGLSNESLALLKEGIESARQGTVPYVPDHLLQKVQRLEQELEVAQACLRDAEAWQKDRVAQFEQEVRLQEEVQTEWERRAGRASSEEFGLTLQLENHRDRLRVVERGLIDIKADIAQAERNLTDFQAQLPKQQAKLQEVRALTQQARAKKEQQERACAPRVDRAAKDVDKLERRLAAARMRAGLS